MEIIEIQKVEERLNDYRSLMDLSYEEAIQFLKEKYGEVQDDYYTKKSYQAFLKGDRKTLTKGKYSRTKEGLYCHHTLENESLNLGDRGFIKEHKYPFKYQQKKNLVYCDLLEHLILHALIVKETSGKYGVSGYVVFLEPMVMEWYVDEAEPKLDWMRACKRKAFVTSKQLQQLFKSLFERVDISLFHSDEPDRILDYQNSKIYQKELELKREKWLEEYEERRQRYELERSLLEEKERKAREERKKERLENFKKLFPNAISIGITLDSPRQKLLNKLFEYKYSDIFSSKNELKHYKLDTLRGDLLKELEEAIKSKAD